MVENEMILFTKDKMLKVFGSLDIKTEKKEDVIIVLDPEKDNKEQAICEACEAKIDINNLGHIAHGSKKFYCKNPACFSHFIAERKLWR